METEPRKIPPPPRVIASFASGFDAIANHIPVIVLPVLVDLFLWLGPHLGLKKLLQPLVDRLPVLAAQYSIPLPDPTAAVKTYTEFLNGFNLFAALRTFPVGVASLMSGQMITQTPLGSPSGFEVTSFIGILGCYLLIILTGWFLGSLYFHWVSGIALKMPRRAVMPSVLQALLLSAIWAALLVAVSLPVLFLFSLLSLISPVIAQGAILVIGLFALWVVLPVFFSPHGIFAYRQNALAAILNGLRMIRYTMPTSGMFLLGLILVSQGLDFLWNTPAGDSWWMLVGIAGHAFISTALLAASFVYYRDVNAWLKVIFEQLKIQPTSARV